MSSAAARAEARRQAILSRGADRLSKLTSSARGEDAPQFVHDDPPLPQTGLKTFVGEETANMPAPTARVRATPTTTAPAPSARVAAAPKIVPEDMGMPDLASLMGENSPLAALIKAQQQQQNTQPQTSVNGGGPKPKTRTQKLLPLIHLMSVWFLLAYFTFFLEPQVYAAGQPPGLQGFAASRPPLFGEKEQSFWSRWADLRYRPSILVQPVSFIWAFVAAQSALYVMRIFAGYDRVEPPALLAMALPHLPPPVPTIVNNGLKYLQLGGLILDDLSALVVGTGFLVAVSSWYRQKELVV